MTVPNEELEARQGEGVFGLSLKTVRWRNLLLVMVVVALLSAPVYTFRVTQPVDNDYGLHVVAVEEFLTNGNLEPATRSHPVLQFLMIGISKLSGGLFGFYAATLILMVLMQALTAGILYLWLGNAQRKAWEWWRSLAAISFSFLAPVMLYALLDGLYYYGYIGFSNYHNPTTQLLKPIALLSFILALEGLKRQENPWPLRFAAAVLVTLSSLIKPNFVLAFLPALGLATLYRLLKKEPVDLKMMIFGYALPSIAVLLWQWSITYQGAEYANSIGFGPFVVESYYSRYLLGKFLLSTLFVLQGLFVFRRVIPKDPALLLGSLSFIVGVLQNYLLIEQGTEMLSGNFRWSGQIVLFLMTAVLLRKSLHAFILEGAGKSWQKWLALVTYLAHLGGGVAYYIYCLSSIHYR